jgi:putative hemolysin
MKNLKNSFSGVRAAKEHLLNGGGLGLFPAGEVSTYHGNGYTEDIEWTQPISKMILKSNVPVIPVYFHGQNSSIFHALGKIHPLLRTAQLPKQLLNKKDQTISLRIGKVINPSEIQEHNINSLRKYLRNRTYALEAQIELPVEENQLRKAEDEAPIAPSKGKKALLEEIKRLDEKGNKLFDTANFSCFIADYEDIPALIHEIGIKREEAFRAVGEGTGHEVDLDKFDIYYKHLILWDNDKEAFAGAYRLGIGEEIVKKYGKKGFYSHTLFKYSKNFVETLSNSIELGRSFVALEYKKEALPLMLLIRGLMYSVLRYDQCKYLFGPVSISSSYPLFYRSLMTHYILEIHSRKFLKENVHGRTPFKPDFLRVDPKDLIETKIKSIETFDRFMLRLSDNQYRLPTLVKQYLKLGAKIACFNVDKDFNYCIDGLVFLRIADVPKDEILKLARGAEDPEKILNRFNL